MSGYLKGNYKVTSKPGRKAVSKKSTTQEFERRALEKLGGSIAFVLKKDTFVWQGEPTLEKKEKPKGR